MRVGAIPTVENVISLACDKGVVARPSVDDVVADSSAEDVFIAAAAHLVIAALAGKLVWSIGAQERAALVGTLG